MSTGRALVAVLVLAAALVALAAGPSHARMDTTTALCIAGGGLLWLYGGEEEEEDDTSSFHIPNISIGSVLRGPTTQAVGGVLLAYGLIRALTPGQKDTALVPAEQDAQSGLTVGFSPRDGSASVGWQWRF